METLIDNAIKILLGDIKATSLGPDSALKITQSVLNLAHAKETLANAKKN